jgi:hypothetical protein
MERVLVKNPIDPNQVKSVWDTRLPDDLPDEIKCKFCEKPKQLLRLNDYIAFWVHTDLDTFRKCKILTFRTSFIKNVMKSFKDIHDRNKLAMEVKPRAPQNSGPT